MAELSQLHHIGLTVKNVETSIAFYQSLFSLEQIARVEMEGPLVSANLDVPEAKILVVLLKSENSILELVQYITPTDVVNYSPLRNCDVGAPHVCFAVDDIDEFNRKLEKKGFHLNGPPNDPIPDGPAAGSRFAYFRDPDGITVEVLQPGAGIALC